MSERANPVSRARRSRPAAPVVLFVHGAFASPWMWQRRFMPHLASHGIDSVAIRYPGADDHQLQWPGPGLTDYVGALEEEARQHPRVLVVGHSLGALVAQLALPRIAMSGLMLMAPAPPSGMAWSSLRLAASAPGLWTRTALSAIDAGFADVDTTREALFREQTSHRTVIETHEQMRPQPVRPLMEAQWPHFVPRAGDNPVPVRVVAATEDRLISRDVADSVAAHHGCEVRVVDDCGHALMLDDPWRESVSHLVSFVDQLCA